MQDGGMVDALAGEEQEQEEQEGASLPASNDGPARPSSPSSPSSPPPRAAPPAQRPSTPTQPPAHPQPPQLQTSPPPPPLTPSAATPAASYYYDCPGTDGLEEGDDDDDASGFATPLGSSSAHTLRRSSSAFSLGARSLTGSPIRLASALRGEAAEPQEEKEAKGEGPGTSSTPQPPTPIDAPDDDDGRRDMHEVVCASQRLSEAAIHIRFAGLRAAGASAGGGAAELIEVEDRVVLGAGGDSSSSVCRHLAIIALRPDAVAGAVTTALVEVARAQGLLIAKRQGPHVVAEMAPSSPGRWEWAQVDMQLCVDRQARDRVLLVRFLLAPGAGGSEDAPGAAGPPPPSSSSSSSHHGGGRGEEEAAAARRRRPATRAFLEALRRRLVELGLNRHGACVRVRVGVRFDHRRLCLSCSV